jgi:polyphosphate kinase
VEVLTPVDDPSLRGEIDLILETSLSDNRSSFQLEPDGTWERRRPAEGEPERSAQEELMARALETARVADEEADREEAAERIVRAATRRGEELK